MTTRSRKDLILWRKMIYSMMIICIISFTIVPATAASRPIRNSSSNIANITDASIKESLKEVSDLEQMQQDAINQISDQIEPSNLSFPLYSQEYSEISGTILDELYTNWIDNPGYQFIKQEIAGWNITTIQTPEKAVSIHETTTPDGAKIVDTTTYSERPSIKIIDSDDAFIDNINIPVLPEPAGVGAYVPEYKTETYRIHFGWELPSIHFRKDYSIEWGIWPVLRRFSAYMFIDFEFHLYFPVDITITHPTRIFEGQSYEFNCTVVPINDPEMEEFKFLLNAGAGWSYEKYWWQPAWCDDVCWWGIIPYPCDCHDARDGWSEADGDKWSLADKFPEGWLALSQDYKTPLGSHSIPISLPSYDILELLGNFCGALGLLANIFSVTLGLGRADVYGDSITGVMSILGDDEEDLLAVFSDENGETKRMEILIPDSEHPPSVKFAFTQLEYTLDRIVFNPWLYIGFDNWGIFRLEDWFGGVNVTLPQFSIPLDGRGISSDFAYYSNGVSVTEDYNAIYDFDMTVKEWYTGYSPYGHMQRYLIDLSNINLDGFQNDIIRLSVSGLPKGYKAKFDAPGGLYWLSGPASGGITYQVPHITWSGSYPIWAIKTVFIPFGNRGKNQALLTVLKEGPTDAPPGDWNINITAISQQRENHMLQDSSISELVPLNVPELYGIDLKLDDGLYNNIPVNPGEYFGIDFYGQNLGNVQDTVNITARIGSTNTSWSETYSIDPYGTTIDQYFSGQFGFTFDRTDLFPNPGKYMLEITANSTKTPLIDARIILFLNFKEAYDIESSITPTTTTIFANWEKNFTLSLTNMGNTFDNFTVEAKGWNDFLTFPDRVENVTPLQRRNVTISLKIPNPGSITPDTYNFRIEVKSEGDESLNAFSVHNVGVTVLEPDYVPPGIVQVEPKYCTYPESSLTLGPSWKAYDEWPDTYTIYINDTIYETGSWTEDIPIQAPVTGINPLIPGLYNVTITFSDVNPNTATEQVWVRIVDQDMFAPIIQPLPSRTSFPVNFSQPYSFYWNNSEEFPYSYEILLNGTPVTLIWQHNLCMKFNLLDPTNFKFNYTIHPQEIIEGVWNITFVLQDMSNNFASDSVFITITGPDSSPPNITEFPISSANLGYGALFQLTATDSYPETYMLWTGTNLLSSGVFLSGVPLVFDVDTIGLMVGTNDLKLDLIDLAGNLVSYQWTFTLSDIDAPILEAAPPDLIFYEFNYTMVIPPFWSVTDLDSQPGTFTINLDGITIAEGVWTKANGTLDLPLPYLEPGTHHYDAYFRDATGNTLYSPVDITLVDITKPSILSMDFIRYEPLYSADWFEFLVNELHPSHYSIYQNGSLVKTEFLTDFPYVLVRLTDLSVGDFNITIRVEDESGNVGHQYVNVKVSDYTPPLITRPSDIVISEGALNQLITWQIREANPLNYSLYRNGVLQRYDVLTGSVLSESLSELSMGSYTFTLLVYDSFGNSHSCTSYVTVLDMTSPTCPHLSNCVFVVGSEHAELSWVARDLHPATYQFIVNEIANPEKTWDGSDIPLQLVGWTLGNHTVELVVKDSSGNVARDLLSVEIIEEAETYSPPVVRPDPGFELFLALAVIVTIVRLKRVKKKK